MTTKRYFELVEGTSSKFWEIPKLDLSRNALTATGIAAVQGALERASCGKQRSDGSAPEFLFRYVATMERIARPC